MNATSDHDDSKRAVAPTVSHLFAGTTGKKTGKSRKTSSGKRWSARAWSVVGIAAGTLLIVGAGVSVPILGNVFWHGDTTVSATVIEVARPGNDPDAAACAAVANFEIDGEYFTGYSDYFSKPCTVELGDTVQVTYNAEEITRARVIDSTDTILSVIPWLLGATGVTALAGGVWAHIARRRAPAA